MSDYNVEQDEKRLFQYYMDTDLLPLPHHENGMHINKNMLELIIRPECNQKCEYCYIYRYGDELYPTRINKKETLHNIKLILDYIYFAKNNFFYQIELFAGDLFFDDIYFDIINLLEKYIIVLKEKYPELFKREIAIITPSNLAFVAEHPEKAERFIDLYDKFRYEYNVKLAFSWSSDGIYAVDVREKKDIDESYFDKIIEFCRRVDAGYHPMVSAYSIKNMKKNYDWWLSKFNEFELAIDGCDFQPGMLEVRNGNEWSEETINDYLDFLTHVMSKRFEMCGESVENLARHFFDYANNDGSKENILRRINNYDPLVVNSKSLNSYKTESMPCSMQHMVTFNCTNLSMVICHRTSYSHFTGIYFVVDKNNEHIVDFNPHNVSAFIMARTMNIDKNPGCINCDINESCLHGCIGAQYEYSGEILMPIPSVCKLMKAKAYHLIKLYNEYGLVKFAIDNDLLHDDDNCFIVRKSKELGYLK